MTAKPSFFPQGGNELFLKNFAHLHSQHDHDRYRVEDEIPQKDGWGKKEKEKKIELDVVVSDTDSDTEDEFDPNNPNTEEFELLGGKLGRGVVLLTPSQNEALLDKLGFDGYNHYISKLADFIIEKDAKVSNHYATILKWARQDKAV